MFFGVNIRECRWEEVQSCKFLKENLINPQFIFKWVSYSEEKKRKTCKEVKKMKKHTSRGLKQDRNNRSKEGWERGRGAKRKGNPRYKPVHRNGKKVYILRSKK